MYIKIIKEKITSYKSDYVLYVYMCAWKNVYTFIHLCAYLHMSIRLVIYEHVVKIKTNWNPIFIGMCVLFV